MSIKKFLIAITGGYGSGKSLFSNYLLERNEVIINSDIVAKELMTKNERIKEQIQKILGTSSYLSDGSLNSKFIADKIFSDSELYRKLTRIVHPPTIVEIKRQAQREFKKRNRVFVESALVFEAGIEKHFDFIILIKSDVTIRLKRIIERDKISPDEFFRRIQFQIDPDEAEEHSDLIIINNGTLDELYPRFQFIYNLIKTLTDSKPKRE